MEAPHKHRWILYAAIAGVVIIGGIIYYIESNKKAPKTKSPTAPITPVTPTQAASSFPIQYGATGAVVKNLQNGLNQYENVSISITGVFDAQTLAALQTATGGSAPVTQSQYNEIIAPPNASNSVSSGWNEAAGDLPTTGEQASAVLLDPNATQAQINAAESINATILGGGTPGTY